ncbi:T6SS immunity protein Tli4 family protein [Massilia sp. erpn]|uniref:T6SS immunity protein Tli4 family protein n=1 Tax=Massilia sp. erpn TaxID=2738142 RepID=UPI0021060BAE|nr:T6SS immunity protein Tli4 family protein [Massilia sp. erpn]UTY59343.1 hypothetical protein HPQ68_20470 [Massilia sp. erpn]
MIALPSKKWNRRLVALGIVAFAAWTVDAASSMKDREKVAKMTEKMQTVCVGRLLIDLPEASPVSFRSAFIQGIDISTYEGESEQEFLARLAHEETEINAKPNKDGTKNMESVTEIKRDGLIGKIFIYGRNTVSGFNGRETLSFTGLAISGYVHADGVSFDFTASDYDPTKIGNLSKLIDQLRPLAKGEIPSEPGFCFKRGIIRDPLVAAQRERVTISAHFPGHPDVTLGFDTAAGLNPSSSLLARDANNSVKKMYFFLFKKLRAGKRAINGIPGEELLERVRESNLAVVYGFQWESLSNRDSVFLPEISLEFDTGLNPNQGGKPVQSSLSEAATMAMWDKISSSLRVRPTVAPQ